MDYTTFCLYGIEHSTARLATLTKYIYIYIFLGFVLFVCLFCRIHNSADVVITFC